MMTPEPVRDGDALQSGSSKRGGSAPMAWTQFVSAGILCFVCAAVHSAPVRLHQRSGGLKGYIHMNIPSPPPGYGYGVSFYANAWALVKRPLANFQIGLPSTWIIPNNVGFHGSLCPVGTYARDHWPERGPTYQDVFQTIEGGLGFWASTQFPSPTAKFRMNGTPDGYSHQISSPLWGFGETKPLATAQRGLAQLSNRLLVPPDGLTFRRGTWGKLFGNAWMALPLTKPTASAPGVAPTGDQSWTLFLNAANFKGPVAFWLPETWSRIANHYPPDVGRGLDARPARVDGGAMEVNTVPYFENTNAAGVHYSRVPRLQFPVNAEGCTVLMLDVTLYSRNTLYTPVKTWLNGGAAVNGDFNLRGAYHPACSTGPIALRQGRDNHPLTGINQVVQTTMLGRSSFGLRWNSAPGIGYFPTYFKQEGKQMVAVRADHVPPSTHLAQQSFQPTRAGRAYSSPENAPTNVPASVTRQGPFHATLSDGTTVTYYWYRFVDQPSLQHLHLRPAQQKRLQRIVEAIQSHWLPTGEYLPPPSQGKLATLDPALLVRPPKGLEIGYVPIVTQQSLASPAGSRVIGTAPDR